MDSTTSSAHTAHCFCSHNTAGDDVCCQCGLPREFAPPVVSPEPEVAAGTVVLPRNDLWGRFVCALNERPAIQLGGSQGYRAIPIDLALEVMNALAALAASPVVGPPAKQEWTLRVEGDGQGKGVIVLTPEQVERMKAILDEPPAPETREEPRYLSASYDDALKQIAALEAEKDALQTETKMLRSEWSVMARACGNYRSFGQIVTPEAAARRQLIADADYQAGARAIVERDELRAERDRLRSALEDVAQAVRASENHVTWFKPIAKLLELQEVLAATPRAEP